MKLVSKWTIGVSALSLLAAVACESRPRDAMQGPVARTMARPEEQESKKQDRDQRELLADADKHFAEAVSKLESGDYEAAGELLLLVRKVNPDYPGLKARLAEVLSLRDKAAQAERESVVREDATVQLKGDTIGLPDGTKSRPVAVVAVSEEDLYKMMRSLAASDVDSFFAVVREERATLVPAGTTARVLERRQYRELEIAQIEITSGELSGRRLWTHPFFLP